MISVEAIAVLTAPTINTLINAMYPGSTDRYGWDDTFILWPQLRSARTKRFAIIKFI